MRPTMVLIAIGMLFRSGCADDPTSSKHGEQVAYFSFEQAADTTGWEWFLPHGIISDHAPGCGRRALFVHGGNTHPAARVTIGPMAEGGHYRFSVWAKVIGRDTLLLGSISLGLQPHSLGDTIARVKVNDRMWRYWVSGETSYCRAGGRLRLYIMAASFFDTASAGMVVDGIGVHRTKD